MAKVASADVLLIEDSLEDAELTIYALRGTCTHITVDTFTSGEAALAHLTRAGSGVGGETGKPQLILLDYDVPGVDAKESLRTFKAHEALKSIPVVVLTSQHDPNIIKQCYELGANSVLCKAEQLRDYFLQIQQLAKYWLLVNAAATAELDESEALDGIPPTRWSRFNELRN